MTSANQHALVDDWILVVSVPRPFESRANIRNCAAGRSARGSRFCAAVLFLGPSLPVALARQARRQSRNDVVTKRLRGVGDVLTSYTSIRVDTAARILLIGKVDRAVLHQCTLQDHEYAACHREITISPR